MKKWKYTVFDLYFPNERKSNIDQELEQIGDMGWEVYHIEKYKDGKWPNQTYSYTFWCKKEKEQ